MMGNLGLRAGLEIIIGVSSDAVLVLMLFDISIVLFVLLWYLNIYLKLTARFAFILAVIQ